MVYWGQVATPTTDYAGLVQAVGDALAALEINDFLTARRKACEAQFVILALGNSATANGSNLQLSIQTVEQILGNLTKLEIYWAAKTTNGREIRLGLFNGGRRGGGVGPSGYGGYGGVSHD